MGTTSPSPSQRHADPGALLRLTILCIAVLLPGACSGEDDARTPPEKSSNNPFNEYAIHVFVGSGDDRKRLDLPPVREATSIVKGSVTQNQPGTKPLTTAEIGDGGTINLEENQSLFDPGWLLLLRAAIHCGASDADAPWRDAQWYIFPDQFVNATGTSTFDSCDEIYRHSEILLCTADQLSSIADAVSPVVWTAKSSVGGSVTSWFPEFTQEWRIPVQSNKDRFIVRDLAFNVLANLARLDFELPLNSNLDAGETCADGYARSTDLGYFQNRKGTLYGVPSPENEPQFFEPKVEITDVNRAILAEQRLSLSTHILRSAGRLLRELIDKSVYADLGGARVQRARAADHKRGAELMWGARSDFVEPYNSLAHVARVLFGRWESGLGNYDPPFVPTHPSPPATPSTEAPVPAGDPSCGGHRPLELLTESLDAGTSARWQDRPIRTTKQAEAVAMIDAAGIVIPKSEIDAADAAGTFDDLRGAVLEQLAMNAAIEANVIEVGVTDETSPEFLEFTNGPRGQALIQAFLTISPADLHFALERSFDSYRLLAAKPADVPEAATPTASGIGESGVHVAVPGAVHGTLELYRGGVLTSTAPRLDIGTDIMARMGPAIAASQCPEYQPAGVDEEIAAMGKVAAFQDAFMIGETYRRRLSALRDRAEQDLPGIAREADFATAELRGWTGPGLVMFRADYEFQVRVIGLTPKDLAVEDEQAMKTQLFMVYGEPWVADCAAGLREQCPENFAADYMQSPSTVQVNAEIPNIDQYYGSDGRVMTLTFRLSGPSKFEPSPASFGLPETEFLYLIAKADPANPGKGRVLSTFPYRDNSAFWHYGIISDYQRKLANDTLNVQRQWAGKDKNLDDSSTDVPTYCVQDVPADMFVPLENELTSDSDNYESSWKHYLNLAEKAAAEADALGRELIEVGLQQDLRREAAGEELAKICGDFSAMDDITVKKGLVKNTSGDETLNLCLNEPTYDIVFLTTHPLECHPTDTAGCTEEIQDKYLNCGGAGSSNPLCTKTVLEYASLDLVPAASMPGGFEKGACELGVDVTKKIADASKGVDASQFALMSSLVESRDEMRFYLSSLRLSVEDDLNWELRFGGQRIMSTKQPAQGDPPWPYCKLTSCPDDKVSGRFDALFGQGVVGLGAGQKDVLLWRVSGALWTMAALAGEAPEGLFELPVPAINLSALSDDAPVPMIYGFGRFNPPINDEFTLNPTKPDPADIIPMLTGEVEGFNIGGPARRMKNIFAAGAGDNTSRPSWIRGFYDLAYNATTGGEVDGYLHVPARSSGIVWPEPPQYQVWLDQVGKSLHGARGSDTSCDKAANAAQAIADHGQLKRPKDAGPTAVCTHGEHVLLRFNADSAVVADVLVAWAAVGCSGGNGFKKEKDVVPGGTGSWGGRKWSNNEWDFDGLSCQHAMDSGGYPVPRIEPACVSDRNQDGGACVWRRFTSRVTSHCSKNDRAQLFVNSYKGQNACAVGLEAARAFALPCVLAKEFKSFPFDPLDNKPPEVTEPEHLILFESWLEQQALRARLTLGRMALQYAPKRVVSDIKEGLVGSGSLKGDHGQLIIQYEKDVEAIATGWQNVETSFAAIKNAVGVARTALKLEEIGTELAVRQIAMQHLAIDLQIAHSLADAASRLGSSVTGLTSVGALGVDLSISSKQKDLLNQMESLGEEQGENQALMVLQSFQEKTGAEYAALKGTLDQLRTSTLSVLSTANAIKQKQGEATYQAAKGAGADYVKIGTGSGGEEVATFPVNAVLRRQYSIAKRRYEHAKENAVYLSYVARLAIEQRLGQRLSEMTKAIGALAPPAEWADDVCQFEGVNYDKLSEVKVPEAGAAPKLSVDYGYYADPFIGDYVAKLRNFVEYYNIEYPSHDGDDVAVLSVRDDLLGPQGQCYRESVNLLHYSHELEKTDVAEDGSGIVRGWVRNTCTLDGAKCVQVAPGKILKDVMTSAGLVEAPPAVGSSSGMTWLFDMANTPYATPEPLVPNSPPANSVYQSVELQAGQTYVLSWWDMARDADGGIYSGAGDPVKYWVAIHGPNWEQVKAFDMTPSGIPFVGQNPGASGCSGGGVSCTSGGTCCSGICTPDPALGSPNGRCASEWSPRRTLEFQASATGQYHVVIGASGAGTDLGSVAIANMQLEAVSASNAVSAYEGTGASRLVPTSECAVGQPDAFRARFQYKCAKNECFYELTDPILIDTRTIETGESKLIGKIARGNFNFRHITVAANVVGTGVNDCSSTPSPSCYGSAFVEYTLDHDAYAVPVLDAEKKWKEFNFGSAAIRRGKAIAAERFITLPIGSADQQLLAQPQVEKPEFRGRPLSGYYRLRIYDQPSLVWNNVEDVQLVLKYRYWSRVAKDSSGP